MRSPLCYFLHALPSSSFALAFLIPSLHNSSLFSSQVTRPCFHCLCICFLPFGLTSRELGTSVLATLSVDETSPTGCRKSPRLLQVNYIVLHCWQQETHLNAQKADSISMELLGSFTKLVINRNTEVEHLLSFLSSHLLPHLEAPYSTQWMPLSVRPSYPVLCLDSAQYQTSNILISFCILPSHIYGTSQLGRSWFCA